LVIVVLASLLGLWILLGFVGWLVDDYLRQTDVDVGPATRILIWTHEIGIWWLLGGLAGCLAGGLGLRFLGGAGVWRRFLGALPLIGPLWVWSGVTQMAWLLGILLERQIALPEALRLTAGALPDAHLGSVCVRLADRIDAGQAFSEAIRDARSLPATLVPIVRWGERTNAMPEALQVSGDMFLERVLARSELVHAVVPPVLMVVIGTGALALMVGLYAPIFEMLRWWSMW
jgi:type II secretory pathway component PulF